MIQRHALLRLAIASAFASASGASPAGFIIDTEINAGQTLDSGVGEVTAVGKLSVGGDDPAIDVTGTSGIGAAGTVLPGDGAAGRCCRDIHFAWGHPL